MTTWLLTASLMTGSLMACDGQQAAPTATTAGAERGGPQPAPLPIAQALQQDPSPTDSLAPDRRPTPVSPARRTTSSARTIHDAQPTVAKPTVAKESKKRVTRRAKIRELLGRMGPALRHDHRGLQAQPSPDGHRVVPLAGRFHHALVVRRQADGSLHYGCVDSPSQAEQILLGPSQVEQVLLGPSQAEQVLLGPSQETP